MGVEQVSNDNGFKVEIVKQLSEMKEHLGVLRGKVEDLSDDVKEIKNKLDELDAFRWKMYGASAVIGFLAGIVGTIITLIKFFGG